MDISIIITLVLFVASFIVAYFFGYQPRKGQKNIDELSERISKKNSELLAIYKDVQALIQVESYLTQELGISKQEARKGFSISQRCEPKRIEKRIIELELQMKK